MEFTTIYLTGVFAFIVLFAMRTPDTDAKFMFRAVLVWPFSLTVILIVLAWSAIGWEVEVWHVEKRFSFRKPAANGMVRGFAVTLFGNEFQVYKKKIIQRDNDKVAKRMRGERIM